MQTVAVRSIFMLRRVCRTRGLHKASWFGWYSTRERHRPNWTKLNHDQNCQFLGSARKEWRGRRDSNPRPLP